MTYHDLMTKHNFRPWLGVLPGWSWLEENEHRLDGGQPTIELSRPGVSYRMSIKPSATGVVAGVMKANRS